MYILPPSIPKRLEGYRWQSFTPPAAEYPPLPWSNLSPSYTFILFDLLTWVTVNYFPHVTALPELTGTETLVTVLLSLLGLGAMRTAEKFGGKAK